VNGGFQYDFEWDSEKARLNHEKHVVTFERAASLFLDPEAISRFDDGHSMEEDRWITLGLAGMEFYWS